MTGGACIFCRIIAGEIPCHRVYEDETAIAFLDINPLADGHALVVPKRHVDDVVGDAAAFAEISAGIGAVSALLRDRLGADGVTVQQNNGRAAGQEVFHLHAHVIPRRVADGLLRMRPDRVTTAPVAHTLGRLVP